MIVVHHHRIMVIFERIKVINILLATINHPTSTEIFLGSWGTMIKFINDCWYIRKFRGQIKYVCKMTVKTFRSLGIRSNMWMTVDTFNILQFYYGTINYTSVVLLQLIKKKSYFSYFILFFILRVTTLVPPHFCSVNSSAGRLGHGSVGDDGSLSLLPPPWPWRTSGFFSLTW